jgi:DNA polymerase-3 subunit delta'
MKFEQIPGNEDVKKKLVGTVHSGKYSHAQIFAGSEGSANLMLAYAYAQFINCESPLENDSCGTCPNCIKISKLIHPDVVSIMPVAKTKPDQKEVTSALFAQEWRTFVEEQPYGGLTEWTMHFAGGEKNTLIAIAESRNLIKSASLKSFEAKSKVYIIWLPEKMNTSAANTLLKIIEEPPADTLMLLVSNDFDSVLGTIQSRCLRVNILPFKQDEVKEYLKTKDGLDENTAALISSISEGNINKAVQLSHEVADSSLIRFEDWMRYCYVSDYAELISLADAYHQLSTEQQKTLLKRGMTLLRECLVLDIDGTQMHTEQDEDFIRKFGSSMGFEKVEKIQSMLNVAFGHIERNASAKMVFLDTSLQIASMISK